MFIHSFIHSLNKLGFSTTVCQTLRLQSLVYFKCQRQELGLIVFQITSWRRSIAYWPVYFSHFQNLIESIKCPVLSVYLVFIIISLNQVSTRAFSKSTMVHGIYLATHIYRNIAELLLQVSRLICEINKWRNCWHLGSLQIFIITIILATISYYVCSTTVLRTLQTFIYFVMNWRRELIAPILKRERNTQLTLDRKRNKRSILTPKFKPFPLYCMLWKYPSRASHLRVKPQVLSMIYGALCNLWPQHCSIPWVLSVLISYCFALAYKAPATLPFFLVCTIAPHIPTSKSVLWGDSPISEDSFSHFRQVSTQNPL